MKASGRVFKYGDNVDTDVIIPARYLNITDGNELAKHCMEDIDADFANSVQENDFIVAKDNFGCGSSREHAPIAIKASGVSAVIAKSFARIFYRNAINIGLLLIECDTDKIDAGDELELDVQKGVLKDVTKNIEIEIMPLPDVMIKLLNDGGLIEHIKKNGDFSFV